jgi:hypothetical protein
LLLDNDTDKVKAELNHLKQSYSALQATNEDLKQQIAVMIKNEKETAELLEQA